MPLRHWLGAREGEAPEAIRRRLEEVVDAHPEWNALPVAEALLAAGEYLLAGVLTADPRDRRTALDLLSADACVTYALEAGAESPGSLVGLSERAMKGIGDLVIQD